MSAGMFTMMLTLGQAWGQDPAPSEQSQAADMEAMPSAEFLQYLASFQTAEGEFVDPLEFDDQAAITDFSGTDEGLDHAEGRDQETRDDG